MRIYFSIAVILILLVGCDSRRVFEDNVEFRQRSWKITEPVQFEFQISDASKKYNVLMNIRNSLDYPYARIFVNYNLQKQDTTSLSQKMIAEYLFDQKTGKPFGTSGIGDIYDHQFPILKNYSFEKAGTYKMKLDQFMRMDTIPGILAVGVRVETVE
ncbi:MAG TPA: gliding motility lipoprotein GldH [Cyclobacteriaceae bacterium]|jgi:gliding motility-associated lipoprotein GldH|nr:gliding motility lipoprotein GldH [Cyclobacteriaceae bacterium]